jgi:hypothetical protein
MPLPMYKSSLKITQPIVYPYASRIGREMEWNSYAQCLCASLHVCLESNENNDDWWKGWKACLVGDIDCGGEGEDGGGDDQKIEDLPRIREEGLPPKHQHAGMRISHGVSCRRSVRTLTILSGDPQPLHAGFLGRGQILLTPSTWNSDSDLITSALARRVSTPCAFRPLATPAHVPAGRHLGSGTRSHLMASSKTKRPLNM